MSQRADPMPRRPRRILPKPFETSSQSSQKPQDHETAAKHVSSAQPTLYSSEPDDNSSMTIKYGTAKLDQPHSEYNSAPYSKSMETMHPATSMPSAGPEQQGKRRRFTPQLMETARRSFRPDRHSLDILAGPQAQGLGDIAKNSNRTEMDDGRKSESPFSFSSLLRRQGTRRHSFRVPDLPAIPSSESEGSPEPDSPQRVASPLARRSDPSLDDRGLLSDGQGSSPLKFNVPFPLHPSKSQLQERALAAFPNEQVYQPVDHFAIDMGEDESPRGNDSDAFNQRLGFMVNRRASSADLPSELEYLRRHKEEAGMNRRHYLTTKGGQVSHVARRPSRSVDSLATGDNMRVTDRLFAPVRPTASPPMLGGDLAFPQSLTPQSTVCEGSCAENPRDHLRNSSSLGGLWHGSSTSSTRYDRGGLWNGTCKPDRNNTEQSDTLVPGLITPRYGIEETVTVDLDESDRFGASNLERTHLPVPSPKNEIYRSDNIDQDEFNDAFVTQIYDYLSLGYPSIARYYDYELSKVSGIPITMLRADDSNIEAKGHLGMHDITSRSEDNGACSRWVALRLYIQEWARQHPKMLETGRYHEAWGVRERKGSWAV
ncbi:hypothetical protein BDV18DRAFT_147067 [Aspergillus unguis]